MYSFLLLLLHRFLDLWQTFTATCAEYVAVSPNSLCKLALLTFLLESCLSPAAQAITNNYAETCVALNIASDLASEFKTPPQTLSLIADKTQSHDPPHVDVT